MPCAAALDFLAEAYVREGGEGVQRAVKLWKSLADEHDTIRKKSVNSPCLANDKNMLTHS